MNANARLYSLSYSEVRTYFLAVLFVACNVALPQLFHLIPQGGIIFAPLSLVILFAGYKFGWQTGLLTALASPLVNHLIFGAPSWGVLQVMTLKLVILAVLAGLAARYFMRANMLILAAVVASSLMLGAAGEWLLTGSAVSTAADITMGWPGLLLQVIGGYLLIKHVK